MSFNQCATGIKVGQGCRRNSDNSWSRYTASSSSSGSGKSGGSDRNIGGGSNASYKRASSHHGEILREHTYEDCRANCQFNPEFNPYQKCGGTSVIAETLNENFATAQCIVDTNANKKNCVASCDSRFKVNSDAIPDLFE